MRQNDFLDVKNIGLDTLFAFLAKHMALNVNIDQLSNTCPYSLEKQYKCNIILKRRLIQTQCHTMHVVRHLQWKLNNHINIMYIFFQISALFDKKNVTSPNWSELA